MTKFDGLIEIEEREDIAWLWLNRPERHNSLTPELVDALRDAAQQLAQSDFRAVVITGRGRSFSTGGDVTGFLNNAKTLDGLRTYAQDIVGGLNEAILALCALPMPLIARVNGPVTGGALGLVLAAELRVMSETAFLQPYYGEVGFAPDGGWTAMLPDIIGSRAIGLQYLNRRLSAVAAKDMGIVDQTAAFDAIDEVIAQWTGEVRRMEPETLAASKRLVRPASWQQTLAIRLEAERQAFVELVGREVVATRMQGFVDKL